MTIEGHSKLEIQYDPDTQENILRRAEKLKEVVKQLEKAGQRPSQKELRKFHIDLDFEDY